uniref:Cell cycle checkpoint protein RAD1 n=1 Tax=Auxenochlorella protothecoides TaxID=3075 RepID=A0A1D1ZXL9_AUXPR
MEGVTVRARTRNIRGVISALKAIKAPGKQVCLVSFDDSGLTVLWEHESKALHSSARIAAETFSEYSVEGSTAFGVRFGQLLDTLALFSAALGGGEVSLEYPGPDAELVVRSVAGLDQNEAVFAHLATLEAPPSQHLEDYGQAPGSFFIAPGATLREAVEDLEWAGKTATLALTCDPPSVVLSSTEQNLSLKIDLPVDQLAGFSCQSPGLQASYSLKHLRTALAQAPLQDHTHGSAKVAMDAHGLMKVTHLLPLGEGRVPQVTHPLHALQSQALAQTAAECVLLFMVLPLEDTGPD